ncbi:MAG: tetratricopeptide repeat protein [Candidatus Dormibacteraeota bacterium]|uniref:Tetratricopeptide repeat protein n=1 Tax=Candidatus Amunia macphersoniae TaxID=3127014 RepID=A0A934KNV9_9BACT|nr:tetratricopeptide repeat protein [Candidatus Dormibacteraeota bacterium]
MQFRVLGTIEVVEDGRAMPLGGPKPSALLAHLLAEAGNTVPRDRLVDDLWGEDPPPTAQDTLNVHLAILRRVLGTRLRRQPNGYMLVASPEEVDSTRFEAAVTAARDDPPDPRATASALRSALSMWSGPVFGGLPVGRTAAAAGARLEELRLSATEDRVEADLAMGMQSELIAELTGLVVANPARERLVGQLMLALHRCGRSADALSTYQTVCLTLENKLGVDPGEELTALNRAIHRGDPTLAMPGAASLPGSASRFVGRDAELDQATMLLQSNRLLTLTGPGGSGKTRLAIELARAAVPAQPGGVHIVDLAPLTATASVGREVASVLGLRERQGITLAGLLAAWLRPRRCLLVLDNCDHLLDSCAELCTSLLLAAPGLRVLATSREPLGIPGEVCFAVAGLRVPHPGDPAALIEAADAVRLLVDRAAAARPGFALARNELATAAILCTMLDGLPLAIELAAVRLRNNSVAELAAWLAARPNLLAETGTVRARHRTMRATIEGSYDLLDEPEQALFRRLSVFASGFESKATHAMGDDWAPLTGEVDILDVCNRLADKSLLTAEPREERTRYRMFEVVRQYAAGRLVESGEEAEARGRHAAWYRQLIPSVPEWTGPDQAAWIETLGREVANVRAALSWYLGDGWKPARALEMVGQLWWFWYMRGLLGEGRLWFHRALAATPAEATADRALALRGAAATARIMGDFAEAIDLGSQSLEIFRALDDDRGVAATLNNLCITAMMSGDLEAARWHGEQSLELILRLGDAQGLANSRNNLGIIARNLGEPGRAAELFAGARDGYRLGGNSRGLAAALTNLAILARRQGAHQSARELAREALQLYSDLDFDEGQLDCLEVLAALDAVEGRANRALLTLTASASARRSGRTPVRARRGRPIRRRRSGSPRAAWRRRQAGGARRGVGDSRGGCRCAPAAPRVEPSVHRHSDVEPAAGKPTAPVVVSGFGLPANRSRALSTLCV